MIGSTCRKSNSVTKKYITKIKIAKAQENLKFLKERIKGKELNFKRVQKESAEFSNRNNNLVSVICTMKQQNL